MKSRTLLALGSLLCLTPACSSSASSPSDAGKADAPLSKADGGRDAAPSKGDAGKDARGEASTSADAATDGPVDAWLDIPFDASPFVPVDGGSAPITEATPETWSWIPFAGSRCRDGSTTGIGVNLNPASSKVMIFLEGGGACFNEIVCSGNPASFGAADLPQRFPVATDGGAPEPGNGILDRTNAANPVKDWSFVYVPYCTGDIHAGNNPAGVVAGLAQPQAFVGYANIDLYLQRLVPTFKTATQVLLTGASGGGFGAAANYAHVQRAFGGVPVSLLDDSGPFMEDPYVAGCLQTELRTLWGLDSTLGADCDGHCNDPNSFFLDLARYVISGHPQRQFGLMESTGDITITGFFSFGADNCQSVAKVTAATFTAGLMDIRTRLAGDPNFGSFYFGGTDHTSLEDDNFYSRTAGTTPLSTWVGSFVAGTTSNVGP